MTETIGKNMVVIFLDRFIPDQYKTNVTSLMRSYILLGVIFSNIIIAAVVMVGLVLFLDLPPENMKAAILLDGSALVSYLIAFCLYRWTKSQRVTAHILVALLSLIIAIGIMITGGFAESPLSQLAILIPVNSYLFLGRKDGNIWLLITVVFCVVASIFSQYGMGYVQQIIYDRHEELLSISMRFVLLTMVGGALILYEIINENLNRRLNAERNKFAHEASHDGLTGVPNRLEFFRRLQAGLNECTQRNQKLGVLYMDLDGFKPINDQYGHHIGDEVLRVVATRLQVALRLSDTVARLGGDEFALILPGIKVPDDINRVMTKILHSITEPVESDGLSVAVSASFGVSVFPDHSSDTDELCRLADMAMYKAKRSGVRYCHFDPSMINE